MHGLDEILATSGFWIVMVLLIFRGPIRERIANAPTKNSAELTEMKARMQALESRLVTMTTEILELREVQDFDRRLIAKTERSTISTARSTTSNVGAAGRLTLPPR